MVCMDMSNGLVDRKGLWDFMGASKASRRSKINGTSFLATDWDKSRVHYGSQTV